MSRILDNEIMGDEELVERTLRPQYLREYIGQDEIISQLSAYRFGSKNTFVEPETSISEFKDLSKGILTMLNDNQEVFMQQKAFIENS